MGPGMTLGTTGSHLSSLPERMEGTPGRGAVLPLDLIFQPFIGGGGNKG